MRARTIDKGSGTADLCTQASDDSSGYPTANITQWIFQPGLTITIKQDNSPCWLPLCPLSSTTHTIVGHHDHYQERSCGSWAECRHKLPKRPQGTVQRSVLLSSESSIPKCAKQTQNALPQQTQPAWRHRFDNDNVIKEGDGEMKPPHFHGTIV